MTSTEQKTKTTDSEATDSKSAGRKESPQAQAARERAAEADRRAAEASASALPAGRDPYEPYDLMTLAELREVAEARSVSLPEDVEKSLLITELRAHQSGTLSTARRRTA